jgi:hypothetical protein
MMREHPLGYALQWHELVLTPSPTLPLLPLLGQ